jgi:hypothetical protein
MPANRSETVAELEPAFPPGRNLGDHPLRIGLVFSVVLAQPRCRHAAPGGPVPDVRSRPPGWLGRVPGRVPGAFGLRSDRTDVT